MYMLGVSDGSLLSLPSLCSKLFINPASERWDAIVPGFTNAQSVQNFRMSEETITYSCNKLCPVVEQQDTTFHRCVSLKKRVAIALWKYWASFWSQRHNSVPLCIRVLCCRRDVVGTRTKPFSR